MDMNSNLSLTPTYLVNSSRIPLSKQGSVQIKKLKNLYLDYPLESN